MLLPPLPVVLLLAESLLVDVPVEGSLGDDAAVVSTAELDAHYREAPTVGRGFTFVAPESGPFTFELRSWSFDAYLVLRDADGAVVAEDDDGLFGTSAQLGTTLTAGASVRLEACALHGERGAFELLVRRGEPASRSPAEREALELEDLERRVRVTEAREGADGAELADVLEALGTFLFDRGRYAEARSPWARALAIRERVLGIDHTDTGRSLNDLGAAMTATGELEAGRALYERALAVRTAVLGPDHPTTSITMSNLAAVLENTGDLEGARDLFERAVAIRERAWGPDDPWTSDAQYDLGMVLRDLGELAGARARFEQALEARERIFGPDDPQTSDARYRLARVCEDRGEFAEAQRLYARELELRRRTYGPEHPKTATTLKDLGAVSLSRGDLVAARSYLEQALAIREAKLGPRHRDTASTLNLLGTVLLRRVDFSGARAYFERALDIREEVLGPDHPTTANSLNLLAIVHQAQGDLDAAGALYERVLACWKAAHGPEAASTATALNNLAVLRHAQGDAATARRLQERALAIREKVLEPGDPDLGQSLQNLAVLLRGQEELEAARRLYERALAVWEGTLGPEHADTALCLNNLATLLIDMGELDEAWQLMQRAQRGRRGRIEALLLSMSEGERFPYLAHLYWQMESVLELARRLDSSDVVVEAYETALAWKGLVGRASTVSRAQLSARGGEEEHRLLEELRDRQAELSRLALEQDVTDRAAHDERLARLREERGRLERELQARAEDHEAGARSASHAELRASLAPRSALVDVLVHRVRSRTGDEDGALTGRRVSAWITRPELEAPVWLDLGPADELEGAIAAFLEDLVARRGAAPVADGPVPGERLRALLWDPLAPHLADVDTVFVSPDGALATLPFETLSTHDGVLAIERYAFVYLQDATSLVRRSASTRSFESLLAVGAVDFRAQDDWLVADASAPGPEAVPRGAPVSGEGDLRGSFTDWWGRLPATEYESQVVVDLHEEALDGDGRRLLLQGGAPSEGRLKHELQRHAVLHLATHGYFQPEGMPSMWETAKDARGRSEVRMNAEAEQLVGKLPGLLSGLVCAGANRGGDPDGDDGYLTAEEVGWLDLSGAELVVLSACETGLGRPQSGEGLLGLRRAFETAGAKTVISSLWSVKDESTAELMRDFYKNLFLKGMGRHEALRAAQLAMLQRNRREHGEALLSTWGAFVLSGEWR